ncbi:Dienelactone hydrolase family protein [Seminavis robusta]|uniref:Dienelactone hydrolase family protein n=1 Tax=Seminavis robusta TaxID=568900 RepID=A0A9N8HUU9_9STRA|nr:Dienelactone hydrolase family protein [Seminavis robusta]|eukprot:Sro1814_g299320.1 Dienelactone hydrolase family protein (300) ;mRNA; r:6642-7541
MTSPCCPPDALPALKFDYKPKGEHFELPGVASRSSSCKLYVVGASPSDDTWKDRGPVLVMSSDIFGPFSGMHCKLADEFASRTGGIALLPDPFEGTGGLVPRYGEEEDKPNRLGFNIFTWNLVTGFLWNAKSFIQRYPWDGNLQYLCKDQLIPYLQSKGVEKFAMMGFCFGSWMILKACNDDAIAEHVTCGIHFHPASELMEKNHFGGDDVGLCRTCKGPQLIHATKNESANWKPDGAAHKALEENENVQEVQFTLARNTQSHGFMTRVDTNIEDNRSAIKEGVDCAMGFLEKYNTKSS